MTHYKFQDHYAPLSSDVNTSNNGTSVNFVQSLKSEKTDLLSGNTKANHGISIHTEAKEDFSERLQTLLVDKSTLKIDYHEILRDLKANGFDIATTNPQNFNEGLDIVRLKYGLQYMDLSLLDMNQGKCDIDLSQHYFKREVKKVFEILTRDYQRLNEHINTQMQSKNAMNISALEEKLQKHINFYNRFTGILENYFHYLYAEDTEALPS